ncbi:MAG: 2OG-Fe(II) oxygenase [Thermodesulfobacteriota bacterium]
MRSARAALADVATIARRLRAEHAAFASATPFPHLVLDRFLPDEVADALAAEYDEPTIPWQALHHVNERKRVYGAIVGMGPVARSVVAALHSPTMLRALERASGVTGLVADPTLDGAGLHRTEPGGYLNVHADALAHAKRRTWSRQLNLILFLNRDWQDGWGGELELWDARVARCVRRITPAFNRCVLFRTTPVSFHGVPDGVACPAGRSRKSLALYYFRDEARVVRLRPTRYVPRPRDSVARRALIHADRALLAVYTLLKRYTALDDASVTRLLRRF